MTKKLKGAIYIPARAFNAPQMWRDHSPDEVRRDIGYARSVGLNAFRVWVSYEFWQSAPAAFQDAFDDFLAACDEQGICVMPSLFENCGTPPTEENMWTTEPDKAFAVNSPHKADIIANNDTWGGPREWIEWFMGRYGNDGRLPAIEVMNEPDPLPSRIFAREMFRVADANRGSVPLTIGASKLMGNMYFMDLGLDILQFHNNFPRSEQGSRETIKQALDASVALGRPVWLTEWQRTRSGGSGWGNAPVAAEEAGPDLVSMAPFVLDQIEGTFFWSLMVKAAYLPGQRPKGTYNGLFWEDGAVHCLADARAIAQDDTVEFEERREPPTWGMVG